MSDGGISRRLGAGGGAISRWVQAPASRQRSNRLGPRRPSTRACSTGTGRVARNNPAPARKAATNQDSAVRGRTGSPLETQGTDNNPPRAKFLESFTHFFLTSRISL